MELSGRDSSLECGGGHSPNCKSKKHLGNALRHGLIFGWYHVESGVVLDDFCGSLPTDVFCDSMEKKKKRALFLSTAIVISYTDCSICLL